MLTPRLTNCQDCDKIPDLLKSIDCKLAEFGSNMYNNVVYMLNQPIPATTMLQLLAYKRILTYKYCNPHYAGQCSVNDIAGKVIRLTAGCVSRCNEPTVCEITTCYVTVVPNPSTTTTSTSSTSSTTTTTTSTSSTTTTTTTIYPDCRVEGCFQVRSGDIASCSEPFNTNDPEGFPDVETGTGSKTLSNGVVLNTSYSGPALLVVNSPYPETYSNCVGALLNKQYNDQGLIALGYNMGSYIFTMSFNPPINAIAFAVASMGHGTQPGTTETIKISGNYENLVGAKLSGCLDFAVNNTGTNIIEVSGSWQGENTGGVVAVTADGGGTISEIQFTHLGSNYLLGSGIDFYVCPATTTTTTTIA